MGMDEVELIELAKNYLLGLGYNIDKFDEYNKNNMVCFKYTEIEKNVSSDYQNKIFIYDISVLFINDNLITVIDNSCCFYYNDLNDFYKNDKSKLLEQRYNNTISFNHLKDSVIIFRDLDLIELFNGNEINNVREYITEKVDVDFEYNLKDGFPNKIKNNSKIIIKE